MSATTTVTIWCDHTKCMAFGDFGSTATDTRRALELQGWTSEKISDDRRKLYDFCPKHSGMTPKIVLLVSATK